MNTSSTTFAVAPEQTLQDALARLEAALLSPVVSGELKSWTQSVTEAFEVLGPCWVDYMSGVQRPQYQEIVSTDADLFARVDQMNQDDRQLLADMVEFQASLRGLTESADRAQKHESKTADERQCVEQAGLAIALRMKKQLAAVATWLQEATFRDRGGSG